MQLQEFYDHLSFGELSQYSIGTDDAGRIGPKDFPRVNSYINLGLTRIHAKLPLLMGELQLTTTSGQQRYELRSDASWVTDLEVPFEDNILVVSEVIDADGNSLGLNDATLEDVITVAGKTITFSNPIDAVYTVTFQANHPKIPLARNIDPEALELRIPDFVVEPLCTYCAGKLLGSGGNAESSQEGQLKLSEFEMLIQQIIDNGTVRPVTPTTQRLHDRGWV